MIAVIDYGMGNIASILNMFKRIEIRDIILTKNIDEINKADKLILPGVGSFDHGMLNLKKAGLIEVLRKKVLDDKVPILGICLGMQLLTNSSQEGNEKGLGFIDAETLKFEFDKNSELKIPHMGWNYINCNKENSLLSNAIKQKFYFVHSYYVKCADTKTMIASCNYGFDFTCAIQKENIYGVQFHPEKSHKFGMQLLTNFNAL